jgi:hypothetical protein
LDNKKSFKTIEEILAEIMQQQGYIPMQQQGYAPADLEMPAHNDDPELPPLPTNKDHPPPWDWKLPKPKHHASKMCLKKP